MTLNPALLVVLVAAMSSPVQTAMNTEMEKSLRSATLPTAVSFFVSTILLFFILLFSGTEFFPSREVHDSIEWFGWLGGLAGVAGVVLLVIAFPHLGSVQTVLFPMLGIAVASFLTDTFGWFGYEPAPVSRETVLGILCVVTGLFVYCRAGAAESESEGKRHLRAFYMVIGFVAGVAFALQSAVNGYLSSMLGSAVEASWISFLVSDGLLVLLILVIPSFRGNVRRIFVPEQKRPWWVWLAGVCGLVYVLSISYFPSRLGVAAVGVGCIFGQLLAGALIDSFGLFNAARKPLCLRQYLALLVVLGGAVIQNMG